MLYRTLKRLINLGKTEGLEERIDVFFAVGKLTEEEYNELFNNPYQAAKYGYIDDVIEPKNTRFRICRALAVLQNKRETRPAKKHGNIPL